MTNTLLRLNNIASTDVILTTEKSAEKNEGPDDHNSEQ